MLVGSQQCSLRPRPCSPFAATSRSHPQTAFWGLKTGAATVIRCDTVAPDPGALVTSTEDLEAATLLLKAGARVNAANDYGVTPLSLAARNGNAAMLALLIKGGAEPNLALPSGESPLMTASRTGTVEAMDVLIAHGADVN